MVGLAGAWALVALARLGRVVEPAEARPGGDDLQPLLPFLRQTIPVDAGYLYVLPGQFGTDDGTAPRLRYELYPRHYDDTRTTSQSPADDEAETVRQLMRSEGLQFIVVPDASRYVVSSWLRQPPVWLRRLDFPEDPNRYVLEVVS